MPQAIVAALIDEVQRLANRVSAKERSRTREALNRALSKYAQLLPWRSLRRTETFTTDGTRLLVFPERVAKIIEIADVTDQARIRPDVHLVNNYGPTYLGNSAGRPCAWREAGVVPVIARPVTDTTLAVEAGASEAITVEIYGTVRDTAASGTGLEFYDVRETIVLGGSSVNTINLFTDIRAISKDRSTTNDVLVTNNQNGRRLARIEPQDASPVYRQIEFDSIPAAGRRVLVEYFTAPDRIDREDQALDPSVNHDYLVWQAVGDLHWLLAEVQNAQVAWAKAEEILREEANKERTFGENSESVTPSFTYQNLEDV